MDLARATRPFRARSAWQETAASTRLAPRTGDVRAALASKCREIEALVLRACRDADVLRVAPELRRGNARFGDALHARPQGFDRVWAPSEKEGRRVRRSKVAEREPLGRHALGRLGAFGVEEVTHPGPDAANGLRSLTPLARAPTHATDARSDGV